MKGVERNKKWERNKYLLGINKSKKRKVKRKWKGKYVRKRLKEATPNDIFRNEVTVPDR